MFPFVCSSRLDLKSNGFQDTKIPKQLTLTKRPDIVWAQSPPPVDIQLDNDNDNDNGNDRIVFKLKLAACQSWLDFSSPGLGFLSFA